MGSRFARIRFVQGANGVQRTDSDVFAGRCRGLDPKAKRANRKIERVERAEWRASRCQDRERGDLEMSLHFRREELSHSIVNILI